MVDHVFEHSGIVLEFVDKWQLHTVAFELNRHAHLPAWVPAGNVVAPAADAARWILRPGFRDCCPCSLTQV
jgi:hypothetical protein